MPVPQSDSLTRPRVLETFEVAFGPGSEGRSSPLPKRWAGHFLPKLLQLFDDYGTLDECAPLHNCDASCYSSLQTDSGMASRNDLTALIAIQPLEFRPASEGASPVNSQRNHSDLTTGSFSGRVSVARAYSKDTALEFNPAVLD